MEQPSLAGKVAIITGSATGIGAATATALARRGAHVLVNYSKSAAEAEKTAEAARAAGAPHGAAVKVVQADVSQDSGCRKLVQAAEQAWGRLDILINNAGTTKFAAAADLDALSAEDFAAIYAVNVVGPFQMARAAAPALKASGQGAIVNVSSFAAISGLGSSIAYAASKGALNTLTLSLARVMAPEVRVNAVCPGYVATAWFQNALGEDTARKIAASVTEASPLKRAATVEDVAHAVLFLAGPESANITGEFLVTDAGLHLSTMMGARH
ncbi:MAG: SDR family oxidoreductase [Alphaproteobacteria bacterium]|nr:SDR family oxidoreductase [Alphaproteobacteria bacterium]